MRSHLDAITDPKNLILEDQEHCGYLVSFAWDYPSDYTGVYLKRRGDDSDWVYAPPFPVCDQLDALMEERRGRDRESYHRQSSDTGKTVVALYQEEGDDTIEILREALRRTWEKWKTTFPDPSDVDMLYGLFAGR